MATDGGRGQCLGLQHELVARTPAGPVLPAAQLRQPRLRRCEAGAQGVGRIGALQFSVDVDQVAVGIGQQPGVQRGLSLRDAIGQGCALFALARALPLAGLLAPLRLTL